MSTVVLPSPARGLVRAPSRLSRTRERLAWALGAAWLLDAVLQLQPFMFTQGFPKDVLLPAGEGSPAWVSAPVAWSAGLVADHVVLLNSLFALTQLAIAVGIIRRRTRKAALVVSIAWALLVWWLGEGLGMLFAGPMSPLMGLPGAVVLYALMGVLVWPVANDGIGAVASDGGAVATTSPLSATGARLAWLGLWTLFVVETLVPAGRDVEAWVLATACAVVASGAFAPPRWQKLSLLLAVALSAVIWTFGEDFGALATGRSTDPNSGPLLALLALCYWPWPPIRYAAGDEVPVVMRKRSAPQG
ncbi:hypothetical protein [Nostocoides sp. HKS02]|uniref:hypothetical protein n=1 Tax=Nostocoides sp. HKS02 TaxID=1813880 RepID=UPI0012B457A6|nr:hypothetical protein [Tetrasphaera sp. HKS02]QGN59069.1 hypothetical protein GKE56_15575 [Tetrasphaera sp. HKS02]